ncbi:SigE family RNA polymerase sigma factor [Nocardioides jishulii]|uniref:SigE family RNA polymerase sigma factor n=1 Tax=Nocardioides jishulii TaxID=2575440 RepID=A0A4U2YSW7_9ACTN|nr:SigE family RNA polymerase sigma factor [Nocardioides jishulii]QCX26310.1 SigE family RNA polymerase sigma factor [Nocardioides jishulii]TKI63885.1 SigE family RNA polymerase sigma factor [Nocardioides jishulii]
MGEAPGATDEVVARLFEAAYRRLVLQLLGVCGDLTEAEEVVQEAFVRAVARGRRFQELDNPEAWLRTVAVNQARSRQRRRKLGEALHLARGRESRPVSDLSDASTDRVVLLAAMQQLPTTQREAIALHHLADLPVAEVAQTLGVPVGTVKARLSRGRTALATLLGDDAPAPVGSELLGGEA